jgi:hypothetical protein
MAAGQVLLDITLGLEAPLPLRPGFSFLRIDQLASWPQPNGRVVRVAIPSPLEDRYQSMLLTSVQVYANIVSGDYDSSLTCPQPISDGKPLQDDDILQFHYRFGREPGLVHDVVP